LSNRPSPTDALFTDVLGPLDGGRIPGGCQHCDAYQVARPLSAGVWNITVHHDDWCPLWTRIREAHP
jgi:hypothetical protein